MAAMSGSDRAPIPVPTQSLLADAIVFATYAHRDQLDKAGVPYIFHPLRVMMGQPDETRRIVAVLHDVVEDCPVSLPEIAMRFGPVIAEAVDALTRRKDETYRAFTARAAQHPIARDVKRADIADNLSPERMAALPLDVQIGLTKRYRRALAELKEQEALHG